MAAKSVSIRQLPPLLFSFVVEQARRIPGAGLVQRHVPLIVSALTFAAIVALAVWMAQRTPQRLTFPELVTGNLAPMQSWIIVSGELRAEQAARGGFRYTLTDPAVPDATLIVTSEVELASGQTTVSGTLVGGGDRAAPGFAWIGQLRADPILAQEADPPWLAIALAAVALFIAFGSRTFYPTFFRQVPRLPEPRSMTLQVGVRRDWPPSASEPVPGNLVLQRGAPVQLQATGQTQELRLHSAHSSVDVGQLRGLRDSEPVLVLRPSSGELTISFASTEDRDAAVAGLVAELPRGQGPRSAAIA